MSWGSILIERIETKQRMSRIVKHNGTIYLCGQVCTDAEQGIEEQNSEYAGQGGYAFGASGE